MNPVRALLPEAVMDVKAEAIIGAVEVEEAELIHSLAPELGKEKLTRLGVYWVNISPSAPRC